MIFKLPGTATYSISSMIFVAYRIYIYIPLAFSFSARASKILLVSALSGSRGSGSDVAMHIPLCFRLLESSSQKILYNNINYLWLRRLQLQVNIGWFLSRLYLWQRCLPTELEQPTSEWSYYFWWIDLARVIFSNSWKWCVTGFEKELPGQSGTVSPSQ